MFGDKLLEISIGNYLGALKGLRAAWRPKLIRRIPAIAALCVVATVYACYVRGTLITLAPCTCIFKTLYVYIGVGVGWQRRCCCCCSHINSHNQVRGHRTGSSHSGAEEYPTEKHKQPKVAHAYITADAIHASTRNI